MASTIENNLREMVEINGNARKLVQKVSKESIATAGNNGNGAAQPEVEVAAAGNSQNGNASNGHGPNGNGRNWNWVNRLKQLSGVVEQEI